MKKLLFLAMAFGLAACSNDVADVNGGAGNGDTEAQYLSVNIMAANGGTRAGNDYTGDYEDGKLAQESEVTKILFYFFDKEGNAAEVTDDNKSYVTYNVPANGFGEGGQNLPNVENIRNATIIIKSKKRDDGKYEYEGQGIPYQTVVVVNPNYTENANITLSGLKAKLNGNLGVMTSAPTEGFVMSNSVYADDAQNLKDAVIIRNNLRPSEAEALANPVDIYVERVVAKLKVVSGLDAATGTTAEGTLYDTGVEYEDENGVTQKIYVKFLSWNATATADNSYRVKQINAKWPNSYTTADNLFQTAYQPWSYENFFRSYWAINPTGIKLQYGNFSGNGLIADAQQPVDDTQINGKNNAQGAAAQTDFEGTTAIYLPENAGKGAGEASNYAGAVNASPTQVIIAAQLVDEAGEPLQLAEFASQLFIDKANADEGKNYVGIKKYILDALNTKYYYKTTENNETKFKSINTDDIKIVTATQAGVAPGDDLDKENRYYVYAVLSATGIAKTWYNDRPAESILENAEELAKWETDHLVTAAENTINSALAKIGSAKIWNTGYTYYYFDIRHLANPNSLADLTGDALVAAQKAAVGYYGVVRNHVYDCSIKTLMGLGTPVYDPDEVIVPEKPDEPGFIAARINILSWRIVNQDVNLNW